MTSVTHHRDEVTRKIPAPATEWKYGKAESLPFSGGSLFVLRLDYLSCALTIASTILVGRRCWEGWALAAFNSVIICIIALRTAQLGFIPANLFCIAMSAINLRSWRRSRI